MATATRSWASVGLALGRKIDRQLFRLGLGRLWRDVGMRKRTRLSWIRFAQLARLAREVVRDGIDGDYAEFGVWRGGSLFLVASLWREAGQIERRLSGFDSFEGLPAPDHGRDGAGFFEGQFADTEFEEVAGFFAARGLDRVELHRGWFSDTIDRLGDRPLALCHIDADLYDSVKLALERTYDLVSPGGVILFDDYGHAEASGATIAVQEFFAGRDEVVQQSPGVDCSAWIRKAPARSAK